MTMSKSIRIALGAAALALTVTASGHAFGSGHENVFTFNGPVALPGVVLAAGSYSFGVASPTALDVVVVRNPKSGHVLYMGFASTVARPLGRANSASIAFGEAPSNQPRPIAAWYEIGSATGHQFLYR
jgi:hypothetical protein